MTKNENIKQDQQKEEKELPVEPKINITTSDIQSIVNLIDVASQRGVFKGSELLTVGSLYNKLTHFLKQLENRDKGE